MDTLLQGLWVGAGETHRPRGDVSVPARLLFDAHSAIVRLSDEVKRARAKGEDIRHERYILRTQHGGMQVELGRLRGRLATALEIADDRGVAISDEDIDKAIAARQQDVQGDASS